MNTSLCLNKLHTSVIYQFKYYSIKCQSIWKISWKVLRFMRLDMPSIKTIFTQLNLETTVPNEKFIIKIQNLSSEITIYATIIYENVFTQINIHILQLYITPGDNIMKSLHWPKKLQLFQKNVHQPLVQHLFLDLNPKFKIEC